MKVIVVGYDGTEPAKRALERAAELSKAFGARVIVASVAPLLIGATGRGIGPYDPVDPPEEHRAHLAEAEQLLAELGVQPEVQLAVGAPPREIAEIAETHAADLIVVGTRDLGFFERLLGLSVSDGVVHRAHCDVLIVH